VTWVYDDGGREAAGFAGTTRDCVTRALAIAMQRPYREVYDALTALMQQSRRFATKTARTGVPDSASRAYLTAAGWTWTPTMGIGTGCTVRLRPEDLPPGRLVVRVSKHLVAVVDGVAHDNHDCTRGGTRCVYGYWRHDG
jgi:hypothetical protein